MPSITSVIRALGNDRAVANAAEVLAVRRREDWLVAGLVRRLDQRADASQSPVGRDSGVPAHAAA